jgi:hypothetical protein
VLGAPVQFPFAGLHPLTLVLSLRYPKPALLDSLSLPPRLAFVFSEVATLAGHDLNVLDKLDALDRVLPYLLSDDCEAWRGALLDGLNHAAHVEVRV